MSAKLPRNIKIGPVRFSVQRCKQVGKNHRTWGAINHWQTRIKIKSDGLSTQNQAVSLMHEIIHGNLTSIGRNDLSDDEPLVERLSENMLDTLWNSPGLMRYFKDANK